MTFEPDVVETVRRMKNERKSNCQIATVCGMSEESVEWLCHRYVIRRPASSTIYLGSLLTKAYRAEAVRRGLKYDEFMQKLLGTIARDNLFTAIIDDGK